VPSSPLERAINIKRAFDFSKTLLNIFNPSGERSNMKVMENPLLTLRVTLSPG